jgi:hypothetical protein
MKNIKNTITFAAAVTAMALLGVAQASTIELQVASSNAGAQGSAAAYRSVVDGALAGGGQSVAVASYDNLSPQGLLGAYTNYAFKSTVDFGVSDSNAGQWTIRSGVDFGHGGALFIDGTAYDFKSNDMWWAGNYNNSSQYFTTTLNLSAGNHVLTIYGLEDCCSGNHQAQFEVGNSQFASFGSHDGLAAAVPEPGTYAMLLTGLGLVGFASRRKMSPKLLVG